MLYRANCWDCNGFYIGKTKRQLHDRKNEHFKALATVCRQLAKMTIPQPLLTTSRLDITLSGVSAGMIISLPSSMADFVPRDRLLQKAYWELAALWIRDRPVECALIPLIIWQGGLGALIASFLLGIYHTDRFNGNGHKLRIYCFQKLADSKQAWPKCHVVEYLLT